MVRDTGFCFRFINTLKLKIKKDLRLVQDGGEEGRALIPLARALESQLTAEQSSTGRHLNSPKKIPHIQRQRRSHSETVGGAQSQ